MNRMTKLMLAFMLSVTAFDVKLYSELYLNKEKMYVKTLNTYAAGSKEVTDEISLVNTENDKVEQEELEILNEKTKTDTSMEISENEENGEIADDPAHEEVDEPKEQSSYTSDLSFIIDIAKDSVDKIRSFYQSCIEKTEDKG